MSTLQAFIHRSAWRDCLESPDRYRTGTYPGADNGSTGLYFGVSPYRRPSIWASAHTFQTVSGRVILRTSRVGGSAKFT
jgi:hypothetical protein